jgi:nucleotide-binding universal stress UspA family protein
VRFARELGADLIVMSTHGESGIKRLLFGSNAERVVQYSSCPVLVVHAKETREVPLHIRRILVPTDFSEAGAEALRFAISFAQQFNASLVLFHAVALPPQPLRYAPLPIEPQVEQLRSAAEDEMRKLAASIDFDGVAYETAIAVGYPGETIADYAERHGMDLILMSTLGRSGLLHVLIGSVAEHVVWHARTPVLVVPARARPAAT